MKNIVVGIDLKIHSINVFKYALQIAKAHFTDLTVAYVLSYKSTEVNSIQIPEGMERDEAYENFRLKKIQLVKAFIQRYHTQEFSQVKIDTVVRFGFPHEELSLIAKEQQADLMIVGKFTKTGSLFFEDTSDKLVSWSYCPLLIIPEDTVFHDIKRIVYASDFILEDCASILYLKPWLDIFQANLICLHVCKDTNDKEKAIRKSNILEQLFPQDNIRFRTVTGQVEKGIDRYLELTKSDMVVTIHQNRNMWDSFFKKSMSKAIAEDVKIPMIIFHQSNQS